jgi:hypothetical protein
MPPEAGLDNTALGYSKSSRSGAQCVHLGHPLRFKMHGFWAGRRSPIFWVLAAPAARKPFPTSGPRSGPPVGRGFGAAGTPTSTISGRPKNHLLKTLVSVGCPKADFYKQHTSLVRGLTMCAFQVALVIFTNLCLHPSRTCMHESCKAPMSSHRMFGMVVKPLREAMLAAN